jgi:hypothetical protein
MTFPGNRDGLEVMTAKALRESGITPADARSLAAEMDAEQRDVYLQQVADVLPATATPDQVAGLSESAGQHEIADWKKGLLMAFAPVVGLGFGYAWVGPSSAEAAGAPGDIEQLLPASGNAAGVGVTWSDRLDLMNLTAGELELEMTYTSRDLGTQVTIPLYVAGKVALELEDPVRNLFGLSGTLGSLSLRAVNKESREFASQSYFAADNMFGQFFPGVKAENAIVAGQSVALAGPVDFTKYRFNLGATAFEDGTHLKVTAFNAFGEQLNETPRDLWLAQGQNQQLNDVYARLGIAPQDDIRLAVEVVSGKAALYGSVVDGVGPSYPGTSDGTTLSPLTPSDSFTFLELGRLRGANQSLWTASGSLMNHSDLDAIVDVSYRGRDGTQQEVSGVVVPAHGTLGYQDLFQQLLGWDADAEGAGTFTFSCVNEAQISGVARSFAILTEGCADGELPGQNACEQVGSMGQLVAGKTAADALVEGETYHFLGLRQFEHAEGLERSHLGLLAVDADAVVKVEQYDAVSGVLEKTRWVPVPAGETVRMNNVLGNDSDGNIKRLVVTTDNPVQANAYRVNQFNDPISIDPILEEDAGPVARILGIDLDYDGIADVVDADGNGVVDTPIELSCGQYTTSQLISENATGDYTSTTTPEGMQVSPSGVIDYTPDCDDAGTTQRATFERDGAQLSADYTITSFVEPKILGLDLDGDGDIDVADADQNGILDSVIDVSCSFPIDYEHWIITDTPNVNFEGTNMPQAMGVNAVTGLIRYNPPCSDSGQTFTPAFKVTGMTNTVIAQYRVGD